ncbi:MAG: site-specific integrase, partial [Planctomycetes bacterium]|nr:site-specific integrase [Planctomycetota bacterium]
MEDLVQLFFDHLKLERGASAHTIKAYREDLSALLAFLVQAFGVAELRPSDLTTTRL